MIQARNVFAACVVALALAGCAGPVRPEPRGELPLRLSEEHPFFDVHWRLEREDRRVTASGLVVAARQGNISEVTLELRGVDTNGQVVSRARGRSYGRPLMQGDTHRFAVRLRPSGAEERFELRVWSFDWEFGRNGNGGGPQ